LSLIIYFFAIVFRQLTADTDVGELYFPSVPAAMMSLLLDGVLPDQAAIVKDCAAESPIFGLLALFFILLGSLTVMNMLVGVLCEVVSVVSAVEKEQLTVGYVKCRLQEIFSEWDTDETGEISKADFFVLLKNAEAATIIHDIGVDVVGLSEFSDFIFKDGEELQFVDFLECVLSFRGSQGSTVKDIVDLRKFVLSELNNVRSAISTTVSDSLKGNGEVMSQITKRVTMMSGASDPMAMSNAPAHPMAAMQQFNQDQAIQPHSHDHSGNLQASPEQGNHHHGHHHGGVDHHSQPGSRPGTGGKPGVRNGNGGNRPGSRDGARPQSTQSSNSAPNNMVRIKHPHPHKHASGDLAYAVEGSARIRGNSPAPDLPAYSQNLWIEEGEGGPGIPDVKNWGNGNSKANAQASLRVKPQ